MEKIENPGWVAIWVKPLINRATFGRIKGAVTTRAPDGLGLPNSTGCTFWPAVISKSCYLNFSTPPHLNERLLLSHSFQIKQTPLMVEDPHTHKSSRMSGITLVLTCLNPAVVFKDLSSKCHSVIVTSGIWDIFIAIWEFLNNLFKIYQWGTRYPNVPGTQRFPSYEMTLEIQVKVGRYANAFYMIGVSL